MAVTNSSPASSSALSGAHFGTAAGVRPSPGAAASIGRQALASLRALIWPTLLRPRTGALLHPNTIAVAVAGYAPLSVTNDLRDIKPPVEIPSGWEWLWWTL